MAFGQTICLLLTVLIGAAVAEFEVINGPEENSSYAHLTCDKLWVAWSNNTAPFYRLSINVVILNRTNETLGFLSMVQEGAPEILEINDDIVVVQAFQLQVLEGSHPIFGVKYFEDNGSNQTENQTRGRPVICATPPKSGGETDYLILSAIYITTSLAIIASLFALLTYTLLKKLRTLAGLVIMNFFISFILGDIMTQIRISQALRGDGPYLEVVALNQGFLIARFLWMSLTGFEMCRSLYQGVRLIGTSWPHHKYVMITTYMSIGWIVTAILTAIMYGVEKWSDSEKAKSYLGVVGYLSYYTPIALTLLFNIVVVVFISVIFYNAARRQKRLKSSYNNNNINFVRVFLIILTVLGLVWIFFFVLQTDVVREARAIIVLYIILTATQPIFVCIAFICTPKVYHMYLVFFRIRQEPSFYSKTSQRQGTVTSLYSDRDLQRGRTIISIVSEKEFTSVPSPDKTTAALPTIEEGDEEEDVTTVENGKAVMEAVNSVTLSNGFLSPTKTRIADKTAEQLELGEQLDLEENEQINQEKHPSTTPMSNGTSVTIGLPVSNGGVSPSVSNGSLNPNREESNV